MGIIKSPLPERDVSADEHDQPAVLLVKVLNKLEYVLSHDNVQETLAKMCLPMLLVSLAMGCAYVGFYFGENYADAAVLESMFTNLYAWFMTLAVLGCGKKWFDRQD